MNNTNNALCVCVCMCVCVWLGVTGDVRAVLELASLCLEGGIKDIVAAKGPAGQSVHPSASSQSLCSQWRISVRYISVSYIDSQ